MVEFIGLALLSLALMGLGVILEKCGFNKLGAVCLVLAFSCSVLTAATIGTEVPV